MEFLWGRINVTAATVLFSCWGDLVVTHTPSRSEYMYDWVCSQKSDRGKAALMPSLACKNYHISSNIICGQLGFVNISVLLCYSSTHRLFLHYLLTPVFPHTSVRLYLPFFCCWCYAGACSVLAPGPTRYLTWWLLLNLTLDAYAVKVSWRLFRCVSPCMVHLGSPPGTWQWLFLNVTQGA